MKRWNPNKILFGVFIVFTPNLIFSQNQNATTLPSGYPTYISTGDKTIDDENYLNAKNKWIEENPEEYKKLNGGVGLNPEENIITEKKNDEKEPFLAIKHYQLIKVEALAAPGMNPTQDELSIETANIQMQLPPNSTLLNFGSDNTFQFINGNKGDFRGVEKRNKNEVEWFIQNKDCASCSKTLYLNIESENANSIIYLQKSEDADSKFIYRFAYELIIK